MEQKYEKTRVQKSCDTVPLSIPGFTVNIKLVNLKNKHIFLTLRGLWGHRTCYLNLIVL